MNEKFETTKNNLDGIEKINNIWEHPVVKGIIGVIPYVSPAIDTGIKKLLEDYQRKKIEELFSIILEDNSITMSDIQSVESIMKIAKTIDVVNKLMRNDKVKYMANLLKNSIKEKDNCDMFEEQLNKLDTLSIREIELLYLLYLEEQKTKVLNNEGNEMINPDVAWKKFVTVSKDKYSLNDTDINSIMLGIMRTGFCVCEWKFGFSKSAFIMYTTPEYHKLLKRLM